MPMAVIRPSRRLAKSQQQSASLTVHLDRARSGRGPRRAARVDMIACPQLRARSSDQLFLADGVRRAAGNPRTQKVQASAGFPGRRYRRPKARNHAGTTSRVVGLQTEVPIDHTGVETEICSGLATLRRRRRRAERRIGDTACGRRAIRGFFQCPVVASPTIPSTSRPRCCWNCAHGLVESASNTSSAT